ncbi:MAG: Fic family protein [Nanoarchaeales archaeon]|nr:Fic family protein [Nanoarchaeales archaeon]
MNIIETKRDNKTYYKLNYSIKKDKKVITKTKYLGTSIPQNIEDIKAQFYREVNKELFDKFDKIKINFQKEYKKIPDSAKQKELEEIAISFTYNTNAIEGSTITLHETRELLKYKFAPNKSLNEIEETTNHAKVFLESLKKSEQINLKLILKWHNDIFYQSKPDIAGKFRDYLVRVGSYLAPEEKEAKLMFKQLEKFLKNTKIHPVEIAARAHYLFEKIHPFGDGNGRVGRILLNYILWHKSFPMIIVEYKKREQYYKAFNKGEQGFVAYFVKIYLKTHQNRYLK